MTPKAKRRSPSKKGDQTFGEVLAEVTITAIDKNKAVELKTLLDPDPRFGTVRIQPGPNNRASMSVWGYYGPHLGSFPADIRGIVRSKMNAIGTLAGMNTSNTSRHKIATRRVYDEALEAGTVSALEKESFLTRGVWKLP